MALSLLSQRSAMISKLAAPATVAATRALSSTASTQIDKISIYGSGLMGSGIVQVAAQAGKKVTMVDTSQELLDKASDRIEKSLQRVAKKAANPDEFIANTLGNITTTTSAEEAAADTDLVLEAIPEQLELKHDLFSRLDSVAKDSTIFASNTSSIKISQIASCTERLDRFGGLHFFNPVPVMKLLEVVRTDETSAETHAALLKFGTDIGKEVVDCKDTPGFIVNRLLVPYLLEAARMVERGDASFEDVDKAMKLGAGHPMGPFQLLDYVGLDTTSFITKGWAKDYPDEELFQPVKLLDGLVEEGRLGLKSGKGVFDYSKK